MKFTKNTLVLIFLLLAYLLPALADETTDRTPPPVADRINNEFYISHDLLRSEYNDLVDDELNRCQIASNRPLDDDYSSFQGVSCKTQLDCNGSICPRAVHPYDRNKCGGIPILGVEQATVSVYDEIRAKFNLQSASTESGEVVFVFTLRGSIANTQGADSTNTYNVTFTFRCERADGSPDQLFERLLDGRYLRIR